MKKITEVDTEKAFNDLPFLPPKQWPLLCYTGLKLKAFLFFHNGKTHWYNMS